MLAVNATMLTSTLGEPHAEVVGGSPLPRRTTLRLDKTVERRKSSQSGRGHPRALRDALLPANRPRFFKAQGPTSAYLTLPSPHCPLPFTRCAAMSLFTAPNIVNYDEQEGPLPS